MFISVVLLLLIVALGSIAIGYSKPDLLPLPVLFGIGVLILLLLRFYKG